MFIKYIENVAIFTKKGDNRMLQFNFFLKNKPGEVYIFFCFYIIYITTYNYSENKKILRARIFFIDKKLSDFVIFGLSGLCNKHERY